MSNSPNTVPMAEREWKRPPHRFDLIFTDFAMLNLAFLLAAVYVYGNVLEHPRATAIALVFLFANLAWIGISFHYQAYRWYERVRIEFQLAKVLKATTLHAAMTVLFCNYILSPLPVNLFIAVTYVTLVFLLSAGRAFHHLRRRSIATLFSYVIVGGLGENLRELDEAFQHAFGGKAKLIGRFGNTRHPNVENIGSYDDLIPYLESKPLIDKVVLFYSKMPRVDKQKVLQLCNEQFIDLEIAPREASIFPRGYEGHQLGDMIIMTLRREPLVLLRNKIVKRVFDCVFSTLVIILLLSWLIPLVGLLIKLKSPGPVFFIQERSGYGNRLFKIIKFRSMHVNNDSDSVQATAGDKRIFRFGEFLRKSSIDELPQFLNVFLGDMSVVGPRPHMLKHTQEYSNLVQTYMIRHKVKPGVTGWAQVNGYRGPTDELWKMKKRVEYDVRYLENWSLPLDIRCVIYTIVNAIRGEENAV